MAGPQCGTVYAPFSTKPELRGMRTTSLLPLAFWSISTAWQPIKTPHFALIDCGGVPFPHSMAISPRLDIHAKRHIVWPFLRHRVTTPEEYSHWMLTL